MSKFEVEDSRNSRGTLRYPAVSDNDDDDYDLCIFLLATTHHVTFSETPTWDFIFVLTHCPVQLSSLLVCDITLVA